jgi:hypothetical protein
LFFQRWQLTPKIVEFSHFIFCRAHFIFCHSVGLRSGWLVIKTPQNWIQFFRI